MPSVDEMERWTADDARQEINKILPAGWSFEAHRDEEGWCHASFHSADGPIWSESHPDLKLLLLNAFGWLWLRGQKPKHPAWRIREGAKPARPAPQPHPAVADPPDLDPEEINSLVYGKRSKP
jgi:hypothetical protein